MQRHDEIWVVAATKNDTVIYWATTTRREDAVSAVELLLGPGWAVALTERRITPAQAAALKLRDNYVCELQSAP